MLNKNVNTLFDDMFFDSSFNFFIGDIFCVLGGNQNGVDSDGFDTLGRILILHSNLSLMIGL